MKVFVVDPWNKKQREATLEDVSKDLEFLIDQSWIIEHMQDFDGIRKIREKYVFKD